MCTGWSLWEVILVDLLIISIADVGKDYCNLVGILEHIIL